MGYRFGAHMSVAGGLDQGVLRASEAGCDVLQIFTKNNNQWACKDLSADDIERFKTALQKYKIGNPVAHASYLINLAAPDDALWEKSIEALAVEWDRANCLALEGLVVHPGSYTTTSTEVGIRRVIDAVVRLVDRFKSGPCRLLLENTAGQGTNLGADFAELGEMLKAADAPDNLGICFDTCHAFAAGHDFRSKSGLSAMVKSLDGTVGMEAVKAIHLNDSKKGCGSRVDRHEHIGLGEIGREGFALFLTNRHFKKLPMYLETPKGTDPSSEKDWDIVNLNVVREIVGMKVKSQA